MAGTITQVGIYKFLMVLIWLAVPVCAYFFVTADQERFMDQSAEQRTDCDARIEIVRRYSRLLSMRAAKVPSIANGDSRAQWQQQFSQVTRALTDEMLQHRNEVPSHYPEGDAYLLALEQMLAQQEDAVRDAARQRSAYLMAGRDLIDRAREIRTGRDTAAYYRSIGAYSIAELINDEIDLREREYERQLSERNERAQAVSYALDEAARTAGLINDRLNVVTSVLESDEQLTYQQNLRQRFAEFNLRAELYKLSGMPEQP